VGIGNRIPGAAVPDFQVKDVAFGAIDQMVRVAAAGPEPSAQRRFARECDQDRMALQHVDELVLLGVRMTQCGNRAGRKAREVDPEALMAFGDPGFMRLLIRVIGRAHKGTDRRVLEAHRCCLSFKQLEN
jgi:hypothetical protein